MRREPIPVSLYFVSFFSLPPRDEENWELYREPGLAKKIPSDARRFLIYEEAAHLSFISVFTTRINVCTTAGDTYASGNASAHLDNIEQCRTD